MAVQLQAGVSSCGWLSMQQTDPIYLQHVLEFLHMRSVNYSSVFLLHAGGFLALMLACSWGRRPSG